MYVRMYVCMYVCMYSHYNVCMYISMHRYICIYISGPTNVIPCCLDVCMTNPIKHLKAKTLLENCFLKLKICFLKVRTEKYVIYLTVIYLTLSHTNGMLLCLRFS